MAIRLVSATNSQRNRIVCASRAMTRRQKRCTLPARPTTNRLPAPSSHSARKRSHFWTVAGAVRIIAKALFTGDISGFREMSQHEMSPRRRLIALRET